MARKWKCEGKCGRVTHLPGRNSQGREADSRGWIRAAAARLSIHRNPHIPAKHSPTSEQYGARLQAVPMSRRHTSKGPDARTLEESGNAHYDLNRVPK